MRRAQLVSLLFLLFPAVLFAQGVSCPAVVTGADTTLNCNDCVRLRATPVSGFTTTTYTVQSIPYNPYAFNVGNSILVAQDDAWGPVVNLPFNFCYYGTNYTQCQAGSNGMLSFTLQAPNSYCPWPINNPIPSPANPMNCIMGPWHDINPSFGGTVFTQLYGVAPCRVFVVSWENNAMFSCTGITTSQQIAIYETTNIVEVYIRSKPLCSTWNGGASILGVHNANGTQAVVVPGRNYPTQWSATNEGWRFVPAGAPNYTVAWYQAGNPVPLTTLDTITVCPTAITDYYAQVVYTNCNGTTVTVRDTTTINATVSSMVLTTTNNDVICNGANNGTATVTIVGNSGPVTVAWSNGGSSNTISGLAPGTYIVTVTEQGGCVANDTVTINEPTAIVLTPSHTDVGCNGQLTGTASVVANGGVPGYTYLWSNGATTSSLTGLAAGNYSVTVTDANLCTRSVSITITQPPLLQITATSNNVSCFGAANGTATTVVTGGTPPMQYLWSNGEITSNLANLVPGVYTVTVTDNNGCTASASVTITQPNVLQVSTTSTNVNCFGAANGTGNATVVGGTQPYVYNWSNGGSTANITNLGPGNYSLTVTDINGCTATSAITITQPTAVVLIPSQVNVLCNGDATGSAGVIASGGTGALTYSWSNGAVTPSITNVVAGTYTVSVTDANGCLSSVTFNITEPTPLVVSATSTDVICYAAGNGTATAIVSGGTLPYQYTWSNNGVTAVLQNLVAGTYTVTVTDAHACTGTATVTITEPTEILLSVFGDNSICAYDSVRLTSEVNGGFPPYSYQWWSVAPGVNDTNPSLVYVGTETRDYYLQITDQNGCHATANMVVVSNVVPVIQFYPDQTEACDTADIYFYNNTVPLDCSYLWEFSDVTTATGIDPAHVFTNGIWSVGLTATTIEGCSSYVFQQDIITILPTPEASFTTDPDISLVDYVLLSEATIIFSNTSPWYATSVDWDFGNGDRAYEGQVTYTYPDSGYYCIKMTAYNDFGCYDDVTQCIRIQQDPFLWIPTAFTPNGDGLNDVFLMGGTEIKTFQVSVFDRWGKTIFYSDSMEKSWDGETTGQACPEGVYTFKVEAVNKLNQTYVRSGTVTLLR